MYLFKAVTQSKTISLLSNISVQSISNVMNVLFNSVLMLQAKRPVSFTHFSHVFIYITYLYADNSDPVIRARIVEFLNVHKIPAIFQKLIDKIPKQRHLHDNYLVLRFTLPDEIITLVKNHHSSGFMMDEFLEVTRLSVYHHIDLETFVLRTSFSSAPTILFESGTCTPGVWSQHRDPIIGSDTLNHSVFNLTITHEDFNDYRLWFPLPYHILFNELTFFDQEIILIQSLKWALFTNTGPRNPNPRPRPAGQANANPQNGQNSSPNGSQNSSPDGSQNPSHNGRPPRRGYHSVPTLNSRIKDFFNKIKFLTQLELDKFKLTFDSNTNVLRISNNGTNLELTL